MPERLCQRIGRAASSASLRSIGPHQLLALGLVELHRLPLDHLVELGIAIAVVVALGAAGEVLVEGLVRVVEPVAGQVEADRVISPHHLRKPLRRVDRLELGIDIDLLQLVDQDHRRIAKWRDVAGRDRELRAVCRARSRALSMILRASARLLFTSVLVAGQRLQHFRRHAPDPLGGRQHGAADVALRPRSGCR